MHKPRSALSRFAVLPCLIAACLIPGIAHAQSEEEGARWRLRAELYGSRDPDRPIDAGVIMGERILPLAPGFDLALGAGVLVAQGDRADTGQPPVNSDATGFVAGGTLRLAPVSLGPVRPFVEGSARVLYTFGDPFPAGGTSVNGFVGWGGGVMVAASQDLSLEAGYRRVHISNGGGLVGYNPAWNGEGGFVGASYRF